MHRLLLLNHVLLFLLCSICLGASVAAMRWGYPMSGAAPMVEAGRILTALTVLMLATAAVLLLGEWFTGMRWTALIVLLAVAGAAVLTFLCIPGHAGEAGPELRNLYLIRTGLWALAWAGLMCWFARLADAARADR